MFNTKTVEYNGVELQVPINTSVGIISEASYFVTKYRIYENMYFNEDHGIVVYITPDEIQHYGACLGTLRMRIIHNILLYYKLPVHNIYSEMINQETVLYKFAWFIYIYSPNLAKWICYWNIIKNINKQ